MDDNLQGSHIYAMRILTKQYFDVIADQLVNKHFHTSGMLMKNDELASNIHTIKSF